MAGKFEAIASKLRSGEEEIQKELRELSDKNDLGFYNLILSGCEECLVVLKARPAKMKKSKRPENDIDFGLWTMIETRTGGKLDMKQSGRDQTNCKGLISIQNFRKVSDGLLVISSPGDKIHQWLQSRIPKWEALGNTPYDVG